MDTRYSKYYTYIKPVLKNKYVKTYSSLVFSLMAITIFLVYAIRPTVATILSLQKSIKEQEEILNKLDEKRRSLTEGRKNYQSLDNDLKIKLVTLLPDSTQLPSLVNDLNSIAVLNSASISGLQIQPLELEGLPQEQNKKGVLKELEFTANFSGSYPQLLKVLQSLSQTNRLIAINAVSFNKPSEEILIMSVNGISSYFSYK